MKTAWFREAHSPTRCMWGLGLLLLGACRSEPPAPPLPVRVTYSEQIAPILEKNCVECHQPGQAAPFALRTYYDARRWAAMLVETVQQDRMPPWHADSHGEFEDEKRVTVWEKRLLAAWLQAGAPEGTPLAPPSPEHPSPEWRLGKPDLVLEPSESFTLAAAGGDVYRHFVLPTTLPEHRYLAAVEIQPGNRKIVHHVTAFVDRSHRARKRDAADPGSGYTTGGELGFVPIGTLGGWAPGNQPHRLPRDTGISLAKGADVVLQIHYHKVGTVEKDRTRVGLYFAKTLPRRRMRSIALETRELTIPAGNADVTVRASTVLTTSVMLYSLMPHMHYRGKAMTVTALLPSGEERPLLHVPRYDFQWQRTYRFRKPFPLPEGTELRLEAHFDNSAANPRNPVHPPCTVHWGENSTDEMCTAFLGVTIDDEDIPAGRLSYAFGFTGIDGL